MNNNLENGENNNTVPKIMPSIFPTVDPSTESVGVQETVETEQPVIIQENNQLEMPVEVPSVSQDVEPVVIESVYETEQPIVVVETAPVIEPVVIQEPVISVIEPVSIQEIVTPVEVPQAYLPEQPVVMQESVPVIEPVIMQETVMPVEMPQTYLTEEPVVMQEPEAVIVPVVMQEPIAVIAPVAIDETVAVLEPTVIQETVPVIEPPVKKKKTLLKLVILALILLVLGLISVLAYFVYSTNEKVIISNSIKQLENFKDYIVSPFELNDSDEYSETGTFNIEMGSTTDTETNQLIDILNSLKFDYNFSKTTEKTMLELNVSDETEQLAGVKLLTTSETGYVFLNKIFDKYIEVEDLKDALSSTNYNDINDYNYLYDFIVKSLINNVNQDDFIKDTAEITIDKEIKKVNSLTLEYTDAEILELINLVIKDIKADEEANEIVTNFYEDFENYDMTSSIEYIDQEHMSTYIYTVYTNKLTNTVEGMDFNYKYFSEEYNWDNCSNYTDEELENMKSTTEEIKVSPVEDYITTSEDDAVTSDEYTTEEYTTEDYTTEDYATDEYTTEEDTTEDYDTTGYYEDCEEVTYTEKTVSMQYRNDTNPRIYLSEDDTLQGFIELIKEDQTLTIDVYKTEQEKLGFIKINSTETLYEVTVDFTTELNEYKLTLSTSIDEVTAGEEYNLDTIITYEEYTGPAKTNSILVTINGNMKTSATIEEAITDSVKYDELTEEQTSEIYNNVINIITAKTGQQ